MLLPKYALCNEVSEVDILHLKVLFCTGGEGTRIKLLHLFFFYLSLTRPLRCYRKTLSVPLCEDCLQGNKRFGDSIMFPFDTPLSL